MSVTVCGCISQVYSRRLGALEKLSLLFRLYMEGRGKHERPLALARCGVQERLRKARAVITSAANASAFVARLRSTVAPGVALEPRISLN